MFNEIRKEINLAGNKLIIETGKIANQSDGSVVVKMGDSVVLCTAVYEKTTKEGMDFLPLTVHYREMFYAAGKIPGGFVKREGKPSDREVLISRLIDRPLRPLFPNEFFNEIQIISTVLSYDSRFNTDILALIGSSAAIALSGAPITEICAASRVGYINNQFVLNPSFEDIKNSSLELVIAGTKSSVLMVESEAKELSEDIMLDAIEFGQKSFIPVIELIEELVKEAGKPKFNVLPLNISDLEENIKSEFKDAIENAFLIREKQLRYSSLSEIKSKIVEKYQEEYNSLKIGLAYENVKSEVIRKKIIQTNKRIDGRSPSEIRQISTEISLLPKTHGSALFTRGETQALVVTTLGTTQDEQIVDSIEGDTRDSFMLQYIFPPYSVGETYHLRAPGRREIGHGRLALRAIAAVMPPKESFPYTVRVVSEITSCNGSSSMATVCGASMALMDAGVPIKSSVAGIAMGLIKDGDSVVVLSDIMGDEDHLGDMDFKVAGTSEGITALQMDIKIAGVDYKILKNAIYQAKEGRIHIVSKMNETIKSSKSDLSEYAPQIRSLKINKDKIRDLIGPGGKVIKEICEVTGAKIDISDDGTVQVSGIGTSLEMAIERIKSIAFDPDVGDIVSGSIVKILDSGAFINISPSKDVYLHISEISKERVENINNHLKIGDVVTVKIIGQEKGKLKVSMKVLLEDNKNSHEKETDNTSSVKENSSNNSKRKKIENTQNEQNEEQPLITERKFFS